MQLIGGLGAVAETMRNCATIADHFAQLVGNVPFSPNGMPGFHMLPPMGTPQVSAPVPAGRRGKRKAGEVDEDDTKKKRVIVRKPKDPNAPKRPPSSYIYYQNEIRGQLKSKYPEISQNELLTRIAKQWSEMTQEQKDKYESKQAAAKEKYDVEKKLYDARITPTSPVIPAVVPTTPATTSSPAPEIKISETSSAAGSSDEDSEDSSSSSSDAEVEANPPPKKKTKATPTTPAAKAAATPAKKSKKAKV